ncbi:phosphotransferase [Microcystis aeruginosa BLCCF158]|uniref:Phosphotransferase n=1 Tax=Microcystis aeruginosa BLCC-F158 TaxID=2755316 RepID=A0A841V8E6_MICAE|nr:phosphotransferase [Microcystis aeruginosa]MBC1197399.1 phosphotransferase [Microcystis aeruginosa BLCC-F158]
MKLILSSQNVHKYLIERGLCDRSLENPGVEQVQAKNFNLLVTLPEGRKLLVKQEQFINSEKETVGEFFGEWRIPKFLENFPELDHWRAFLPELLLHDAENSILVSTYLDNYQDLAEFYSKNNLFPTQVAAQIGSCLATIHRDTWNQSIYREFFVKEEFAGKPKVSPLLLESLERIGPEIFGMAPMDGLKFFALYQRYDSLGEAVHQASETISPVCLTHNDLKLNNILLNRNWEDINGNGIRLIDWERSDWGDPAFDLGMAIASYLQTWLGSLVISNSLSIEESLRLATTPLELLQPSIGGLTLAYLETFPEILEYRPDFLKQVVQLAGFSLIIGILAMIQYQKTFNNTGIAMLQVAKALLSRPESSMSTIFGATATQLNQINSSVVGKV